MADYSDETLRALIRQLITEDIPNLAIGPKANPDRRALITKQLALVFNTIFSKKGFIGLATMGLIFEREFTKDLFNFAIDEFENIVDAVTVFNDTPGDTFDRLNAAMAAQSAQGRKNKYAYLKSLKATSESGESLTSDIVNGLLNDYKKYNPDGTPNPNEITAEDIALYNAVSNNNYSSVFNSSLFEVSNSGQPLKVKGIDNDKKFDDDVKKQYNDKIADERAAGRYVNSNIIEALRDSHEHTTRKEIEMATEDFDIAIDIYNLANEGTPSDVDKVFMLDSIEEIERNFNNSFIASIERKASSMADEAFASLVNNATDIVKKRLRLGNKK
jgi:hypothetical protein